MKTCRLLSAVLLLMLFPIVGLAAMVPMLPAAVPNSPVLILDLFLSSDIDAVLARTGGYPVGPFRPLFGQVVHSQDPDFIENLRSSGAFILLNADQLPNFLCGKYA